MSNPILKKSGIIIATIANLAFPSALMMLLPIIQSAKKGTDKIIGAEFSRLYNGC
jgi:hypothetical protein